jgi:hypothetical protein
MSEEMIKMTDFEQVARARMAAIADVSGIYEANPWDSLCDLDRNTSLAIAGSILNPSTEHFLPSDAHEHFRRLAPADHPDQAPYEHLPPGSHVIEEEGLRGALDAAFDLHPGDERLRRLRNGLAIHIAFNQVMAAIDREERWSSLSSSSIWGNIAERVASCYMIELLAHGCNERQAAKGMYRLFQNAVSHAVEAMDDNEPISDYMH